jgi:hypothetical protein
MRPIWLGPVLLLTGCIENGLVFLGSSGDKCLFGVVAPQGEPCHLLHGDVTVLATSTDAAGGVDEVSWDVVSGGVYPYGPIFVDAFQANGDAMPDYVATDAILLPDLGPAPFTLLFHAPEGSPVYVQAILDRDGDDIIHVAEPSALWHEPLVVADGRLVDSNGEAVDEVHLYVSVPWEPPADPPADSTDADLDGDGVPNESDTDVDGDGTPNGEDLDIDGDDQPNPDDTDMDGDGVPNEQDVDRDGDGKPDATDEEPEGARAPPPVILFGDADAVFGRSCTAMAFSVNGYGPYNTGRFVAGQAWTLYAAPNQGDVLLAGSCDTNGNGLVDPADAWGGWTVDGALQSLVTIGDHDLGPLRLAIPYAGGPTTAAPVITVSGTVLDLDGTAFGPSAVLYVVAQRGTNVPDLAALDHEYAYAIYEAADLTGAATPFSLVVPAYHNVYVSAWVDQDGDGTLDEDGEAAAESGPWYTDLSHGDLELTLASAVGS